MITTFYAQLNNSTPQRIAAQGAVSAKKATTRLYKGKTGVITLTQCDNLGSLYNARNRRYMRYTFSSAWIEF